jgi:hypothetical protein
VRREELERGSQWPLAACRGLAVPLKSAPVLCKPAKPVDVSVSGSTRERTAPLLPTTLFSSSRLALTGLRRAQMASQTRQLAIKTGVVNRCAVCPLTGPHAILITGLA